jgi:hypothetical protein
MNIVNVKGLVLQFDSNKSTKEEVEKVIEACNAILSEANINCQPQLIVDDQIEVKTIEINFD